MTSAGRGHRTFRPVPGTHFCTSRPSPAPGRGTDVVVWFWEISARGPSCRQDLASRVGGQRRILPPARMSVAALYSETGSITAAWPLPARRTQSETNASQTPGSVGPLSLPRPGRPPVWGLRGSAATLSSTGDPRRRGHLSGQLPGQRPPLALGRAAGMQGVHT